MKYLILPLTVMAFICAHADALEAGAAKIDITAPVGTPLNGYGARMGRDSTGIHDPIWSRALFLNDGTTQLFLVSVDLVSVNPELRARVLELAPDIVPKDHIILTATHSHSGHGAMSRAVTRRIISGRFIPEVLESTAQGIVESMRNAYDKRRRAALGYAVGAQEGLSVNRRYSGGPTDPQIGVILIEDADGNPISVVTNFAAHPTSVSGEDLYVFSADYPGFYYLEMEELLGPQCVPIFLNGALGNQTTGNPENRHGWERTESIGRSLARRAHQIASNISFSTVELRLAHKQAQLPRTLGEALLPESAVLHALEINELLLSFFPGEPCVEIGLEMRRRALARGYEAHFSVGLSNDSVLYFVPRHLYPDLTYESSANLYGPGIEDWFYDHFEGMMTRRAPEADGNEDDTPDTAPAEKPAEPREIPDAVLIELAGGPYEIGAARGSVFAADIQHRYATRVYAAVDGGAWRPDSGLLSMAPPFINITAFALPLAGMGVRPLLQGLSIDLIREMEGMAEGARMPFDALWLLQHAPLISALDNKSPLYAAPLCTMFAVVGERAGTDALVVGRNLDWALDEAGVVTRIRPDSGRAFVQVGFPWNAGVFTALNDAGLFLGVERVRSEAQMPEKATVEFILREIIQAADTLSDAVERLKRHTHLHGVHVLAAGFDNGLPRAAVVEFGDVVEVRQENNGLLLGVMPDQPAIAEPTRLRYARLAALFEDMRVIGAEDAQRALTDVEDDMEYEAGALWNRHTRHSVVALPGRRMIQAAFPTQDHEPGQFTNITVAGESGDE